MVREVTHLPSVILHTSRDENGNVLKARWETLTTACGKRGSIRTRESAGGVERLDLFDRRDEGICEQCLVLWDRAEGDGALKLVWTHNGREEWKGPGAVVFTEEPQARTCGKCSSVVTGWRSVGCFAAVVRDPR